MMRDMEAYRKCSEHSWLKYTWNKEENINLEEKTRDV